MQADALPVDDPESQLGPLPDVLRRQCARRQDRRDSIHVALHPNRKKPFPGSNSIPWIFAAKTTASGLIALLVAFSFNLDEPYWACSPSSSSRSRCRADRSSQKASIASSGRSSAPPWRYSSSPFAPRSASSSSAALALWIGLCAFGSQYARNWAAYSFVLSGYTAAIVGIPGALDAGTAFYLATGRVTEISLGIIVAATISHVVLPNSLVAFVMANGRRRSRGARRLRRCALRCRRHRAVTGETIRPGDRNREPARCGDFSRIARFVPGATPSGSSTWR